MFASPSRCARMFLSACLAVVVCSPDWISAQADAGAQSPVARVAGTVKTIDSAALVVSADNGNEIAATVAGTTRVLRVAPGQKDLKSATPIQLGDVHPGDRVLVRGQASADGKSITALAVIVLSQADLAATRQRDQEDWRNRGIGGLVSAVDPTAGSVTLSLPANRNLVVETTKSTVIRQYATGSAKFDDARPSQLDHIKTGDQLRARGTRSEDGSHFSADEIVFGTFRNIAGTVTAMDAASSLITVADRISKTTVVVKVSSDSEVKKLPPEMAQRIATRFKLQQHGEAARETSSPERAGPVASGAGTSLNAEPQRNGEPDFQRLLGRLPNSQFKNLSNGEVVMIVSTSSDSGPVTAINLLAGVEPILTAAPSRAAATMLSAWSLNASGGEADAQ